MLLGLDVYISLTSTDTVLDANMGGILVWWSRELFVVSCGGCLLSSRSCSQTKGVDYSVLARVLTVGMRRKVPTVK